MRKCGTKNCIGEVNGADSFRLKGKQVEILRDPVTVFTEYVRRSACQSHWETGEADVHMRMYEPGDLPFMTTGG